MHVTMFMAMSVNGIIARENGSEDFLSNDNWQTFTQFVNEYGCFIVGSSTYKAVKNWDEDFSFDDFTKAVKVVVSDDAKFEVEEGYTVASSPADALEKLSDKGFSRVLLTGGAMNNSSFAKADLINEIVVNVEPVLIGVGKPLFAPGEIEKRLVLDSFKKLDNGILQLRYSVQN